MRPIGAVLLIPPSISARGLCPHLGLPGPSLLPLGNVPVVVHQLAALAAVGIRHVVLLSGRHTAFEATLAARHLTGLRIDHVDASAGQLGGLRQAAAILDGDAVLLQRGDVLLSDSPGPLLDGAGGAERVEAYEIDGDIAACLLPTRMVRDCDLAADATFVAALEHMREHVRRHPWEGCELGSCDRAAVLAANRFVLDRLEPAPPPAGVTDSEVQGRVVIGRGARVKQSVVRGPAVIGPGADLSHAFVGPYTSVGARAAVEGAEIEHSVVLADASIRFVDTRLASCVIGRGARVERRLATPRSLEMVLAGGDEIRMG